MCNILTNINERIDHKTTMCMNMYIYNIYVYVHIKRRGMNICI